jgi:hypothetical protein
MPDAELTREERDALVSRIAALSKRMEEALDLSARDFGLLREELYVALGEYADRLPRPTLSACPFCALPLKRVFDPFGPDGPWWYADVPVKFQEPAACPHFKVLLGALGLNGREPAEVQVEVRPGPEVPFVVPTLLSLPGMLAVVGRTTLATGDAAYPIAYFSDQEIAPVRLHQPWCRTTLWFQDAGGRAAWTIANHTWAFDLAPFLRDRRLRWTRLEEAEPRVYDGAEGGPCPFVDLPGEHRPQQLVAGRRDFLPPPTGEPINPFG